ncbi:MAG TPA: PHP domain-containing protein [Nitrospirae bacterium]|nr:PHP domain-containing protein [Nitrospirota bacterium]
MLKEFRADLHIHTCLSPCADLDMTPSAIVNAAVEKGIDIIAVTDHNSAENTEAARKAAENKRITVLSGMEVTSDEEAHILALFDNVESVMRLQDTVYESLLPGSNDTAKFGDQVVVNEANEVLGFNHRLLIGATTLPASEIVNVIHSLGGLSIASHIDREAFSIVSQLGFIPDDMKFDALEMSPRISRETASNLYGDYTRMPWVSSSDSHNIDNIGKRTTLFYLKEPTIAEISYALRGIDGRKVEWG